MFIKDYFNLTDLQIQQFEQLYQSILYWNEKINLVSRKDVSHLWVRHILHSVIIAKIISFLPGTHILDVGTGGGFPGIPLAILFPNCHFTLIDSVAKKINVVEDIIGTIGLQNVKTQVIRAEDMKGEFDFIVSRAVTQLPEFYKWVCNKVKSKSRHVLKNGILYLKGGKIQQEVEKLGLPVTVYVLAHYSKEEFFRTKYLLHIPLTS
ncbi:MAG: 16S rRNA (guanine(527)-N(7))-methyltransferase RsmG [Bacteroidia bacterium]|nr:16S rRNA (guanine(527)-N(7))-methyltransferase RsmG [Bacteroidia bacterium]MDW8347015.1 16S rRNA (guanine(527)-N(7))-methyltransferase RsmG [Bacteroidia bacterium]